MNEVLFLVEEAPEGGYTARALGASIFTEADDLAGLHAQVRDAVRCHFDERERPDIIRLHFVRDEVIAVGTLSGILADVAEHLGSSRAEVAERLFGRGR